MLKGSCARNQWTWLPLNIFYEIILTPIIYKQQNPSILQNNKGIGNRPDHFRGALIIPNG